MQHLGLLAVVVTGNRKEVRVENWPTEPLVGVGQSGEIGVEKIGRLCLAGKIGHASSIPGFLSMHMTHFH